MPSTYTALIADADRTLAKAKVAAVLAREIAKAAPADPDLRAAALTCEVEATTAGRHLAELRFEESLDRWVDRVADSDVAVDERLFALAPRSRGQVDWY